MYRNVKSFQEKGFFLLEALLALTALALVGAASLAALRNAGRAIEVSESSTRVVESAERRWLEMVTGCSLREFEESFIQWNLSATPVATSLEEIRFEASWNDGSEMHEEKFITVRVP